MKYVQRAEIVEGLKKAAKIIELLAKHKIYTDDELYGVRDNILRGIDLIIEQENAILVLSGYEPDEKK